MKNLWKFAKRNADMIVGFFTGTILLAMPFLPLTLRSLTQQLISNSDIRNATGLLIVSASVLVAIARRERAEALQRALQPVASLANFEALSENVDHKELRAVVDEYARIYHAELIEDRSQILRNALRELNELAKGVRSLGVSDYGSAQVRELSRAQKGDEVFALASGSWDLHSGVASAEQRTFESANEDAAKREVTIVRIFSIDSTDYDALLDIPFVRMHAGNKNENLQGKVIFRDQLRMQDRQLANELLSEEGYLLIGGRVLFSDSTASQSAIRGKMHLSSLEVDRVRRLHLRLLAYAFEINSERHPITGKPLRKPVATYEERIQSIYSAENDLRRRHGLEIQRAATGHLKILDSSTYYDWLRRRLQIEQTRASRVRVISTRPLEVFLRDENEREFMEWNRLAHDAGTVITRIFVISRSDILERERRSALSAALQSTTMILVAWADDVELYCGDLTGGGMSLWDNVEAFYDRTYFVDPDSENDVYDSPMKYRRLLIRGASADIYFGNHEQVPMSVEKFDSVSRIAKNSFGENPAYETILSNWLSWAESRASKSTRLEQEILTIRDELSKKQDYGTGRAAIDEAH